MSKSISRHELLAFIFSKEEELSPALSSNNPSQGDVLKLWMFYFDEKLKLQDYKRLDRNAQNSVINEVVNVINLGCPENTLSRKSIFNHVKKLADFAYGAQRRQEKKNDVLWIQSKREELSRSFFADSPGESAPKEAGKLLFEEEIEHLDEPFADLEPLDELSDDLEEPVEVLSTGRKRKIPERYREFFESKKYAYEVSNLTINTFNSSKLSSVECLFLTFIWVHLKQSSS